MARRTVRVDGIVPLARGYPAAVVADGLVFVSGMRGGRADLTPTFDALPAEFRANGFSDSTLSDEAAFAADGWTAHENLDRVLTAAGSDASQVLRLHIWLATMKRLGWAW